jgi:hypothetical protein
MTALPWLCERDQNISLHQHKPTESNFTSTVTLPIVELAIIYSPSSEIAYRCDGNDISLDQSPNIAHRTEVTHRNFSNLNMQTERSTSNGRLSTSIDFRRNMLMTSDKQWFRMTTLGVFRKIQEDSEEDRA